MHLKWLLFGATTVLLGSILHADETQSVPKPDKQGFYKLFNGKDLTGWKVSENPQTFKVERGNLVVNGPRSHLFYMGPVHNHEFKNFHLKAEVMTFPKANSGIYFHTEYQEGGWPEKGFECQVNETHSDAKKTGGLYDIKEVLNQSPAKTNKWYTYDIIVKDKTVTLKINGKTTTEWTQPDGWKPPENHAGRVIGSGTIAIQGHDPRLKDSLPFPQNQTLGVTPKSYHLVEKGGHIEIHHRTYEKTASQEGYLGFKGNRAGKEECD